MLVTAHRQHNGHTVLRHGIAQPQPYRDASTVISVFAFEALYEEYMSYVNCG